MADALRREMRYLMRRPRMEDGVAVRTDELIYTHEFFYRLSDIPQLEETEVALEQTQ